MMEKVKLRGEFLTWVFSAHNYHWIRIMRIILRWDRGSPKIQYIKKSKKMEE